MVLRLILRERIDPERQGRRRTHSPRKCTRRLALEHGASRPSVHQILHEARIKNYISRLTHGLREHDPERKLHFCEFMLNGLDTNQKVANMNIKMTLTVNIIIIK
jgi:hypothetical protein